MMIIYHNSFKNKIIHKLFTNCFTSTKIDNNNNLQNITQTKKSINPSSDQGYAYGHYFPKHWTTKQLYKVIDPYRKYIQHINIIQNNTGQRTDKILFKFYSNEKMKQIINKFNQEYIISNAQSYKVIIKPFSLKTRQKIDKVSKPKYGVRISNINFDIDKQELQKLASDFGQNMVEMDLRQNGLNKGFATVYFYRYKQCIDFVNFTDELQYRDRKFKSYLIQKKRKIQQKQLLSYPTYIFQSNIQLMKRQIKKTQT